MKPFTIKNSKEYQALSHSTAMKCYGFPIEKYPSLTGGYNVVGVCYSEDGDHLFGHVSSDEWFLEHDLAKKASERGLEFVYFHRFEDIPCHVSVLIRKKI
jgi:hypothetical protein